MSLKSSTEAWALAQLQHLLELPEESLKEVISYAASLPGPNEVSSHFKVTSRTRLPDPPLYAQADALTRAYWMNLQRL